MAEANSGHSAQQGLPIGLFARLKPGEVGVEQFQGVFVKR